MFYSSPPYTTTFVGSEDLTTVDPPLETVREGSGVKGTSSTCPTRNIWNVALSN